MTVREWLKAVLGPTVPVDSYTDERVLSRFRDIRDFHLSTMLAKWTPAVPEELLSL